MSIDNLLNRLEKVKQRGNDSWLARCPAHKDKSPSLSIRNMADGRVLIHCFAGCDVYSVLSELNMDMSDLFPQPLGEFKKLSRSFPATDVLQAIGFEVWLVAQSGKKILQEGQLNKEELDRLMISVNRIQKGIDLAGLGAK